MRYFILLLITCGFTSGVYAQYAPQAGIGGSTAIAGTSNQFVGWATGCTVKRGYQNITDPAGGYASAGDSSLAIGPADVYVVSLGDSGVAELTFAAPIFDGPGPDFAVFENGFNNPADASQAYLELAFVEVSSDGVHFFRFPATSNTQVTTQVAGVGQYMDASKLNNLAGKYVARYGTPFDLQELSGLQGLDVNHVTHVRVIDAVGDIWVNGCKDHNGVVVNDPYPTPFPTSGFDLDAVGVIHQSGVGVNSVVNSVEIKVFPNPATDELNIVLTHPDQMGNIVLTDITGRIVSVSTGLQHNNVILLKGLKSGVYYLVSQGTNGEKWVERIIKLQD